MGMYDSIKYICLNCEKETYSQTKLTACLLDVIEIGEIFMEDNVNMNLIMKDKCDNCNSINCVEIVNGKIIALINPERATHKEECWGNLNKLNTPKP